MFRILASILKRTLGAYVRWERWAFVILAVLAALSFIILYWSFYRANTILVPAPGGTYIEGSVGSLQPLNPWFAVTNDVNHDINSLVFSGLLRYNPQTRRIEDDLATLSASNDGRTYTVRLKDNLYWHDSTKSRPHTVTADDVLFTYKTIQDPEFPNSLLRQNFRGVSIEKIDDRTVRFHLDVPYSFFPSNLTLGLLPKHSFAGIPVKLLDQTLDFGFHPIGAGPYQLKSIVETELSTEVTLERFPRELTPLYRIDRIVFRIFSDYSTLLSDLRNLDGIRLVPHTEKGLPAIPNRFTAHNYNLPQYTALFFNIDRKVLHDQNLRLGLQLGTNKQDVVDAIGESTIVDTPLLELASSDWRYHFDPDAAQGALFESEWYFPEKLRLQRLLEQREANATGFLKVEPVVLLDTGAVLTIAGSGHSLSAKNKLNGIPLQQNPASSGAWIVGLPTSGGTGSLTIGLNLIKLTGEKNKTIDSVYVLRAANTATFQRAQVEQHLVDRFLASKAGKIPAAQRIAVKDLYLDHGFMRLKIPEDSIGTRMNDRGQKLSLTLLTSPSPAVYKKVAEIIKEQWATLGVDVQIEIPETRSVFEERLLKRNYDILLFGQSLLDNLDSYPYWHSSGLQKITRNRSDLRLDAYNLSQYASFQSDALLETIRGTSSEKERTGALKHLQDILKRDVPAVFLYSPLYTFAHRDDILGVDLGYLSLHSDRFLTLYRWYVQQDRVFEAGKRWFSFFHWLSSLFL